MGFRDLQSQFNALGPEDFYNWGIPENGGDIKEAALAQAKAEQTYRYWLLHLLFEIHGDLDSLSVSYRELVKMQKEKANGK